MSLNTDRESLHLLLFANDSYVNPYVEHKNRNIKTQLVIVFIVMFFLLLNILTAVFLVQTAPTEQLFSTTVLDTVK